MFKIRFLILFFLISILILLILKKFIKEDFIPYSKFISGDFNVNRSSPCFSKCNQTLFPVPRPLEIPMDSNVNNSSTNEFTLENISPCFVGCDNLGICLENQKKYIKNNDIIQILNGSNNYLWFYCNFSLEVNKKLINFWIDIFNFRKIAFSIWHNKMSKINIIFQLQSKDFILLPLELNFLKLTVLSDCPDNLGLNNSINGIDFYNKCLTKCGNNNLPVTSLEFNGSFNKIENININYVEGFSIPGKIEFFDTNNEKQRSSFGKYGNPGCVDCNGNVFPTSSRYSGSCNNPCFKKQLSEPETNICSLNNFDKLYTGPNNCKSGWCSSIKEMYSINLQNLGYCYNFIKKNIKITNINKLNTQFRIMFC